MNMTKSTQDTSRTEVSAYVLRPGKATRRWMGKTYTDFLATGDSNGGKFCLVEEVGKKGDTVPLHKHDADDESFYVLEGEISISLGGGAPVRAPEGSFSYIPAGSVHGFRVESESARYLILTTALHGAFYLAITDPSNADGSSPQTSLDGSRIAAACREYGVEFVGPLPETV